MIRFAILLTILAGIVLSVALPSRATMAETDPFLVSQSLFFLDCPVPGRYTIEMVIHNVSGQEKTFGVSPWINYTYPDEGEYWVESAWLTRITPESLLLPVDAKMIATVEYTLPPEAMNKSFKTWVKVYDDPETAAKPVTVRIRTGNAVPTYQFSISPSSYRLRAYGADASVIVDDVNDAVAPPISIKNEASTTCTYCAQAQYPNRDIVISADSGIRHSADEVGMVFKGLSTEEAQQWFSTPFTCEAPLRVEGFKTGTLTWALTIPNNVKNGNYAIGIRVMGAEPRSGSSVGIEYMIYLLIKVDREEPITWTHLFSGWFWPWGAAGLGGLVGLVVVRKTTKAIGKRNHRTMVQQNHKRQKRQLSREG